MCYENYALYALRLVSLALFGYKDKAYIIDDHSGVGSRLVFGQLSTLCCISVILSLY